ncbi:glycosyltransferase family 2 protein [Saprospira sp. CCB-QB6]|uniref:glycosyltransferase family 2 protein n=1 Tax=Saprospira sp. CCB-QB6 TaxID=3023936 RepID=UPI00234B0974|nr:glycosyltransferase family 2 protein [Saprospira sp. CCB-QB6]WCL81541.1 glycosyltransferase family 2 protein [Saprospira sp. CCB-QB6]
MSIQQNIFVIIVSYNGEKHLKPCLDSLALSNIPLKVVVIDNCSNDQSVQILQEYALAKLILSKENLGFGQANNLGIQYALEQNADYIFLLNQDTWIRPNSIEELVKCSAELPDMQLLSPLQYAGNEKDLDFGFQRYYAAANPSSYPNCKESQFVNAAAWWLKASTFKQIGGFNPLFPHYGEDLNFCHRFLAQNGKIFITTKSLIFHNRPQSTAENKQLKLQQINLLANLLNPQHSLASAFLKASYQTASQLKFLPKSPKNSLIGLFSMAWFLLQQLMRYNSLKENRAKSMQPKAFL